MYTEEFNQLSFLKHIHHFLDIQCKKEDDEDIEYNENDIIDMMFPNDREEWDNE